MSHCIIVGDCDVTLPPLVMHEQYDYIHVHVHVVGDCDVTLHQSWKL